jgi:hypothetical protein
MPSPRRRSTTMKRKISQAMMMKRKGKKRRWVRART